MRSLPAPNNGMPQSISPALVPAAPMAKTAILPASVMLASGRTTETAIQGAAYTQIPGSASLAAAAPDGSLWVLSTAPTGNDKFIWHFASGTWTNISGLASRLSVAPNGTLFAINSGGGAFSFSGGTWTGYGGGASDITAAADGSIYVLSNGNAAGSDQAIWHNVSGTWSQVPGSGVRIAASWDPNPSDGYLATNGSNSANGIYILNSIGGIYHENTDNTFAQLPGQASAITATTFGGVFVLGYPASASGNSIYYFDLDAAGSTFAAQAGVGTSISTDSSKLYVVNSSGGIFSSPVKAVQTWAFGGSSGTLTATAGQTPAAVNLSAYGNISASVQFGQVVSGSGTITLSDALNNGDVSPALPADNATAGFSPVVYFSAYNSGPSTISFGANTPQFTLTKTTGFGGATTCEFDVYGEQGNNGGRAWFSPQSATGTISGNTVTVNSVALPPGNTVDFSPGQQIVAISCK